jgi:hypothetical protein
MVDATKIAKLRAKAMSTGYPEEAAMFERKASELAAQHGIADADIERALAEIFGAHPTRPTPPPDDESFEFPTMVEAVIFVLEEENRPMRAREIWTVIEEAGLFTSMGKTPWATVGAKLATQTDLFERVAPGLHRLREAA